VSEQVLNPYTKQHFKVIVCISALYTSPNVWF